MVSISRRRFITLASASAAGATLAACVTPTQVPTQAPSAPEPTTEAPPVAEPTTAPTEPVVEPSRFSEAPMLAERVAAGELPPVEERLPLNPRVVPVYEAIGKYGGTMRRGFTGVSDGPGPNKLVGQGFVVVQPGPEHRAPHRRIVGDQRGRQRVDVEVARGNEVV